MDAGRREGVKSDTCPLPHFLKRFKIERGGIHTKY
jgi:hypothetical protein